MKIIKGITPFAPKVLVYGSAGVGKTTLAAKFKRPLLMDLENGANYIGVDRVDINGEDDLMQALLELLKKRSEEYDTIVIDSMDMLTRKIASQVAGVGVVTDGPATMTAKKKTMERNLMDSQGGFGKAKEVLENHVKDMLLPTLAALNKAGYGIVLIAHAYINTMLGEDGMSVERVRPKIDPVTIGKRPIVAPLIEEWVDNILYLKKVGEDRIIQVESDDNALAKNRISLVGEYNVNEIDINNLLTVKEKEK